MSADSGFQAVSPSLTVNFGNIHAGDTAIGRWLLTSTLLNLFIVPSLYLRFGKAGVLALLASIGLLLVGAALRLLPMGQLEGQAVLWSLHPVIERVAREAARKRSG